MHAAATFPATCYPCAAVATSRIGVLETFGLRPLGKAAREALLVVRGDGSTPPSRFDRTSLSLFDPRVSFPLWLGRRRADKRVEIYNLFNRTPTPLEDGWSVRVTQVRDFRGGRATYDSHNGTDFACPVGTTVVAAAPGKVLRVSSEWNRGGVKIFVDHGRGLVTTSNHLARPLVRPGDVVRRGDPIALSGASGIDCFVFFPWICPHVHWNVWLDGEPDDPFGGPGETSLFRSGNDPTPYDGTPLADDATSPPTRWDEAAIERAIDACVHEGARAEMRSFADAGERAMAILFMANYYPTRFRARPRLYGEAHPREGRLDLPFHRDDFVGVAWPRR